MLLKTKVLPQVQGSMSGCLTAYLCQSTVCRPHLLLPNRRSSEWQSESSTDRRQTRPALTLEQARKGSWQAPDATATSQSCSLTSQLCRRQRVEGALHEVLEVVLLLKLRYLEWRVSHRAGFRDGQRMHATIMARQRLFRRCDAM